MEGVRVTGIDAHCSVQVLWQYFDDRGAAVKAVYYPLLNNDAVVIFQTPSGTTDVLTRNHEKWKVSPLPNQVFSRQRVWVESDLSMLVQATGAYHDALRNMGQLDISVETRTQELILCGQPYQIEWAWNYLSTLRDNQFHIARTLQTGSTTTVPRLSNGSTDPAYSPSNERSRYDKSHSPRLSRDSKQQREKPSAGDITDVTSLRLESVRNAHHDLSPRSREPFDGVSDRSERPKALQDEDALLSSIKHLSMLSEEQTDKQGLDARERRRRQDDANETFNNFASLPTSSGAAAAAHRDALRHTDPSRHDSKRGGLHSSTLPSQTELERLEAAHKLERQYQSLEHRESRDDYRHGTTGGYQSLQSDFMRQREHGDAREERARPITYAGERATSYLTSSHGGAAAAELSPYMLSSASAELSRKEFQLGRRLKLKVYMDDITKTGTDAVVNAANWELKNIGGVAGALAKAAGPEMAAECSKLMQKHGTLATAQVVKTKAYGKLSHMKYVLHTVGPIYIEGDTERSIFELAQTFYNCLEFAEKLHLHTLTFPFISTGIFCMPIEHCVLAMVTAVKLFAERQQAGGSTGGQVEEIHFVNNDINVVCEAIIMTEQRLGMETVESTRERFEEGKKHYGRYVYPYCQGLSSLSNPPHVDSERYATWDTSQKRHGTDRSDDVGGSSRRTPRASATSYDPGSTREPRSLPQFGTSSDSRHRSSSLDRGGKTITMGSGTQPHRTTTTTGGASSSSGIRDSSPRPQARPRSNSLTLSGRSVVGTASAAAATKGSSAGGGASSSGGGGKHHQPVIKKSLTGSTSAKTSGLAKRLASKKSGAQSGGRSGGGGDYSGNDTDTASAAGSEMDEADGGCMICMEPLRHARKLPCGHSFCSSCIDPSFAVNPRCPRCKALFNIPVGDQPLDGIMTHTYSTRSDLPGYKNAGNIVIKYVFPSGKQQACHPHPGKPYEGIHHTAYLPDNVEGNEVLKMLRKAFDHRLVFTIGSRGAITWNGIHHKTSKTGGPAEDGYPDSMYLRQVKDELRAKGITTP